eukprot:TRINITY_DN20977_c0_g9_i1.p1 TRINITY_DN20977_c0_g9~~TRINITY_DN20977_c0_g9_i1.p1  ORF type:complete len:672 (+),score=186.47 TRINITY_DN20977_c0_g9_i1:206-2221(+)
MAPSLAEAVGKTVTFSRTLTEAASSPTELLEGIKRASSKNLKEKKKNWKAYAVGGFLFTALMARFAQLHYEHHTLSRLIVQRYETDSKKDGKLLPSEVAQFLGDSGINITKEQLEMWIGPIDDENDGFDSTELAQAADFFEHFRSARGGVLELQHFRYSLVGDALLVLAAGCSLVWVLSTSEALERRIAANSFMSAVRMKRMQRKWQELESQTARYEAERIELERSTGTLEAASREASMRVEEYGAKLQEEQAKSEASEEELRRAREERDELERQAEEARARLQKHMQEVERVKSKEASAEKELARLRLEAEKHMQEAHMSTAKLRAMNQCLRGINAFGHQSPFKGAGEGKYHGKGATTGFAVAGGSGSSVRAGFRMQSFVFGYPTKDNVELYEVDKSRDLLGEGADCAYKCRNIATNETLALKIYDIALTHRRQILSDLHAHQETKDHPHIVKYKAVIETEAQIFVLMELIKGKDLFADIIDRHGLREKRAAFIMAQLCDALKFLHNNDIIHGDIKPENVMLESPDSDQPCVKLIDFGFSCFLNKDATDHRGAVNGVLEPVRDVYAPPEALDMSSGKKVSKDIDMFRLGCCLYVMLMATYPFDRSCRDLEDRRSGKVLKYPNWKTLSTEAQDLITTLLKDRISVEAVLEHPWMQKYAPSKPAEASADEPA